MASKPVAASGVDFDAQATRRRNVPSSTSGGIVNRIEADEKKTRQKKVSTSSHMRKT